MYKIKRATITLESGDYFALRKEKIVRDEQEIEALRQELKAKHEAVKVYFMYEEMDETEGINNSNN